MNNSLNLQEIDQLSAFELAKFFIRSNQNLVLLGRKGTGKTSIATQAIESCGYKVNYINLSVLERTDLFGYPQLFGDTETVEFKSPNFLPALEKGKKPDTVIIFDEVDKASPELMAPLLEILQFKKVNAKPLNIVGCILTGNLQEEGAYSNLISTAVLDRCAKFILKFDFDKWYDWAKENNTHDLVLAFLKTNPELTSGKNDDTQYGSPSPRGWLLASDALIKAKNMKLTDAEIIGNIVSGYVGMETGLKFKVWYNNFQQYENIIVSYLENGGLNINFEALLPTQKISFLFALAHLAKFLTINSAKKNINLKYIDQLVLFFKTYKIDEEMILITMQNSFSFEIMTKYNLVAHKGFSDLFIKISKGLDKK